MTIYTKLAADGSDLPADATGHQAVRVEHSMLVLPLIVTAYHAPERMTQPQAVKWAESLDIYGWSWRLSYAGHFKHASSFKARRRIGLDFPWLKPFLSKGQQ